MNDKLLKSFPDRKRIDEIKDYMSGQGGRRILVDGLQASARSFVRAALMEEGVHLVLAPSAEEAAGHANDLYHLMDEERVFFLPVSENRAVRTRIRDASYKVQRTAALGALKDFRQKKRSKGQLVLVSYPEALQEKVPSEREMQGHVISLKKGDAVGFENLRQVLAASGFVRCDFVSQPGEFAVRGSIVDLFSYGEDRAHRIDFFGDEIESIREIDINTQRSVREREKLDIYPNLFDPETEMDRVDFTSLLPPGSMVWADRDELLQEIPGLSGISVNTCSFSSLYDGERAGIPYDRIYHFRTVPQPAFNKNFELLAEDLKEKQAAGYRTVIFSESQNQVERLRNILSTFSVRPDFELFTIQGGFYDPDTLQCFYTDHQIFDRYRRIRVKRMVERSERLTVNDLNAFKDGDYIVHIDHGVGRFGGLVKNNINGRIQEAVKLIFKDNDVIFVSVHSLHRISRYKSADGTPPRISKLGTGAWQKLKNQTKSRVKDMAADLIRLYAKRRLSEGFAFSADTYLQHELESSFIYEDTPDQSKAVRAVKEDMEKSYPMDRLICGDVGFGKTEVAVRAAFKAVADSKQVAVLVPTTILALQHYHTFSERLKGFPCTVEYVSRLRTAAEMRDIAGRLEAGRIDILVGTHRLLNKDLHFKDLGLLIIDEEQKFGVAAKERLRQLKVSVDTLTLSATPIPRTLQFSLLGARDLSIINTPPPNRLPVQTEIIDFDEELIRDIIHYETGRGGQVIYVHNRVEDILSIEEIIRRIVPDIKTCVAHGQMEPREMEKRVLDFIAGDYDLLLATTIVENGIDIPNVNTIIINQAQNFGLSDLHQLRGRVGRSNKKAFCYLIVPPTAILSDEALRRLKAIEAFSELGSGFNIAMQDLDIRGMGNMLGAEQSGYMAEMGYETYQRILEEAFEEVRGSIAAEEKDAVPETAEAFLQDCTVETDQQLLIPDDYIGITAEKIRIYREMDSITDEADLDRLLDSLRDRFGPVPEEVQQLAFVVRLRKAAREKGFEKVVLKNEKLVAYFIFDQQSPYFKTNLFLDLLKRISAKDNRRYAIKEQKGKLYLTVGEVRTIQGAYNVIRKL